MTTKTVSRNGRSTGDDDARARRGAAHCCAAYDKRDGREVGALLMQPAPQSGSPMTYMLDGRQYIVVAVSGGSYSGEFLAFALPNQQLTLPRRASSRHSAARVQPRRRGRAGRQRRLRRSRLRRRRCDWSGQQPLQYPDPDNRGARQSLPPLHRRQHADQPPPRPAPSGPRARHRTARFATWSGATSEHYH